MARHYDARDKVVGRRGRRDVQRGDEGVKRFIVADRHLRENFAVQFDAVCVQGGDEAAVLDTLRAAGGIDAGDPELAELALAVAAVAVGILPGLHHLLIGALEQARLAAEVARRLLSKSCGGACASSRRA